MSPREEAARFAAVHKELAGNKAAIVYGFGAGYHIEELLAAYPSLLRVVAVECNLEVLYHALSVRDFSGLFFDPRFTPLFGRFEDVRDKLAEELSALEANTDAISVVVHSPSLKAIPETDADGRQIFEYIKSRQSITDSRPLERLCIENIEKYGRLPHRSRGIGTFSGAFTGVPAIIAGAGPSLDRNSFLMRHAKRNALVISVDSALAPLMARGCEPHFAVTADPQENVKRYFANAGGFTGMLIHNVQAFHDTVASFAPERRFAAFTPAYKKETEFLNPGEDDFLRNSPSVFLTALDFAVRSGAGPIVFVGCDLAFAAGKTHASGSAGMVTTNKSLKRKSDFLRNVTGYYGPEVFTSLTFFIYLKQLEQYVETHPETEFYNATEGGAAIRGAAPKPLKEFLFVTGGLNPGIAETIARAAGEKLNRD
jgi:hypothetical protein